MLLFNNVSGYLNITTHSLTSNLADECLTYKFQMNLWTAGQWTNPNSRSDFVWKVGSSMQPMPYTNWYPGNTDGARHGTTKPCLMLWLDQNKTYTWNGMPCDAKMCFVCQLEA